MYVCAMKMPWKNTTFFLNISDIPEDILEQKFTSRAEKSKDYPTELMPTANTNTQYDDAFVELPIRFSYF